MNLDDITPGMTLAIIRLTARSGVQVLRCEVTEYQYIKNRPFVVLIDKDSIQHRLYLDSPSIVHVGHVKESEN